MPIIIFWIVFTYCMHKKKKNQVIMKDRGFYSYICVFVIDLAGVLRVYLTEIQVGTGGKKKKGQEPLLVIADSGYYKYTA